MVTRYALTPPPFNVSVKIYFFYILLLGPTGIERVNAFRLSYSFIEKSFSQGTSHISTSEYAI